MMWIWVVFVGLRLSMKSVGVVGWCDWNSNQASSQYNSGALLLNQPDQCLDKNEVFFHHNRRKYTMIKGQYQLKLCYSIRKTFFGHTLRIITENLFLSVIQTSLKGLSWYVFQQVKFKFWYSLLSYQVLKYAVINISEERAAYVLRVQVHSQERRQHIPQKYR